MHFDWYIQQNSVACCFLPLFQKRTVPRTSGKAVHVQPLAHLNCALYLYSGNKLSSICEMTELPQTAVCTQDNLSVSLTYSTINQSRCFKDHFFTWIFFLALEASPKQLSLSLESKQPSLLRLMEMHKLYCDRTSLVFPFIPISERMPHTPEGKRFIGDKYQDNCPGTIKKDCAGIKTALSTVAVSSSARLRGLAG